MTEEVSLNVAELSPVVREQCRAVRDACWKAGEVSLNVEDAA
jgi:hypothetical protein